MASRVPIPQPPRDELIDLYFNKLMRYEDLATYFGVSIPTIAKWFKNYKINPRMKYEVFMLKGVPHKRCFGRLHPEGKALPTTKFHRNAGKRNNLHSACTDCENVAQRVVFQKYKPWVESIYRRLGYMETCRRLNINERTLTIWLGKDKKRLAPTTIRRESAIKITQLMAEVRLTGEVRHRKSIRRGAALRGETERVPKRYKDFLVTHTDAETEYRRNFRNNMTQEQREDYNRRERERKRLARLRKREAA